MRCTFAHGDSSGDALISSEIVWLAGCSSQMANAAVTQEAFVSGATHHNWTQRSLSSQPQLTKARRSHCSPYLRRCPAAPGEVCPLASTTTAKQVARKTCTACIYSGQPGEPAEPAISVNAAGTIEPVQPVEPATPLARAHQAGERKVPVRSLKAGATMLVLGFRCTWTARRTTK